MIFLSEKTIVLDSYRIENVFNSGGMGVVYQARHLGWDIDVAIKHPRPEFMLSEHHRVEFENECAVWSSLGLHPYLTTCFYTRQIDRTPCVFAEFINGGSLRDWIISRTLYSGEEEAAIARILTISVQIAWGLERAHLAGLVHCDMKPGNVLISSDGTAKVTDFGLARALADSQTKAAGLTPAYASPEQSAGNSVSHSTDIWSWAVTVFEMFTGGICWGKGPAAGAALEEFGQRGYKAVGLPPMPSSVFSLLERCLRWRANERPTSFKLIADELLLIYEELFGEPCSAQEPDLELVAADSLNNRAVSQLDIGKSMEATALLKEALALDSGHPEALLNLSLLQKARKPSVPFALAKPRSGEDLQYDTIRFNRLMAKAEASIKEGSVGDTCRYMQMASDIPGFARHPRLQKVQKRLSP